MLSNVMIGRYYPVKSVIHRMHPLAKIWCTVIFIIMCFMINTWQISVVVGLLLLLIMFNSHIPFRVYFKVFMSMKVFFVFLVVIGIIMKTNYIVIMLMLLRLIYIVLYTSILTLTASPFEIARGLELFFFPLKFIGVPVNKMAFSISLAIGFIPSIIDQANKILNAQSCRGALYYGAKLKEKIVTIRSLIIPMFVLTLKRADNMADVMEVRLYDVNAKRTSYGQNKWRFFDTYLVMVHLLMMVVIIVKGVVR